MFCNWIELYISSSIYIREVSFFRGESRWDSLSPHHIDEKEKEKEKEKENEKENIEEKFNIYACIWF